jgi:hypothetical protein
LIDPVASLCTDELKAGAQQHSLGLQRAHLWNFRQPRPRRRL